MTRKKMERIDKKVNRFFLKTPVFLFFSVLRFVHVTAPHLLMENKQNKK